MRTTSLLVFSSALAAVCVAAAPLTFAQSTGFTATERTALVGGELVRRDLSRLEGGRMLYGGASWQRLDQPIDEVWRTVVDAQALTRLIPSVDEARVVEERDGVRTVYLHHSYGVAETGYYVTMRFDHTERSLTFALDPSRPHDIRQGRGHLRLTSYRSGTIAEWSMLVDPGGGLVTDLFGPMLSEWLLLPPRCLRDEMSGSPTC
jgi:hypothetical protein